MSKKWKQVTSDLRLPWSKILVVLAVLITFVYWSRSGDEDPFEQEMSQMELLEESSNAFIHSAYYYKTSNSLGENAVAIVATMSQSAVVDLNKYQMKIVGTNSTTRLITIATMSTEHNPDGGCDYTTVLIQTNTVKNLGKLELASKGRLHTLPILEPKKEAPKPVIFCIAPLFAAEQWQSLLMNYHVSKRFGAHLHVYVTTLVEQYYQLAREFNDKEMISIQAWLSVKFTQVEAPFAEPNRILELRNPAAAYTDCLLQYKEAAQFVGFLEMEDLLFPVNANTYYEEFEREYEGSYHISALYYQVLEQQSFKSSSPEQQSIADFVGNMNTVSAAKLGRTVVRPQRYNSTWTHFSTQVDKKPVYLTEQQEDPLFMEKKAVKTNAVLSFRQMETVLNITTITSLPMNPMSSDVKLLSAEQADEINEDIQKTLNIPSIAKIAKDLPTQEFYTPYLKRCISGQKSGKKFCVNTKDCELPNNATLVCRHSDALYHSGWTMMPYTFHFATEPYYTRNLGCYQ
uniref:Glycosyltransferase family 92 protein n=1 Tax=Caenorhabditis japonica TaxID=281687 RepID=A0A8R1DT50_CAEJA